MAPALHLARSLLWQHAPGHLTNPLATGLMSVRDCQERRLQMKGLLAAALFATLLHFSHAGGINTSPAIQTSGPGLLDASVVTGVASRQCTFSAQWKYCLYKIPSSVCDELNRCNPLCTSLFYFLIISTWQYHGGAGFTLTATGATTSVMDDVVMFLRDDDNFGWEQSVRWERQTKYRYCNLVII